MTPGGSHELREAWDASLGAIDFGEMALFSNSENAFIQPVQIVVVANSCAVLMSQALSLPLSYQIISSSHFVDAKAVAQRGCDRSRVTQLLREKLGFGSSSRVQVPGVLSLAADGNTDTPKHHRHSLNLSPSHHTQPWPETLAVA